MNSARNQEGLLDRSPVKAWSEVIVIPTYGVGKPNRNPMFLERRVYQGSSGAVYPHPVIDQVSDQKTDREYTAVYLENQYLKIMLLPELGGRVQMALDKTNDYHFVYYNRVIKPALVGLCGPWISGGIEFNWPQHHRPSTFQPVDWSISENPDGSRTVWCSEIERMFRTQGTHGLTLHPDRALLEIAVRLHNRTSEPQTFLWWANPAVHAGPDYQSVFPPDVHAVLDHGKRDVSDFPIATGVYYKHDYAPGTDISRYSNIPVPTSYMAHHSEQDFLGCYDHGKQAGMLHVANHHLVPGKKQWTWGQADFGRAWDRQLTDRDGPYVELMCGAFTDNQPDFSWLMPGEEKSFTQVFLPYKRIGPPKHATRECLVNLELAGPTARLGVYVTRPRKVRIELIGHTGSPDEECRLFDRTVGLSPEQACVESVALPRVFRPQEITLRVLGDDRALVEYTPEPDEQPALPSPATAARAPEEIESNEELFLNGLHLEQYRHATYLPEPYYQEALRRDPGDSRCNNALGLLLYRRGRFAEAEPYFRKALERLTLRNPNPYDGEPTYNLGLCLRMLGRHDEAFDAFYKAVWNEAWKAPAYFELARLACRRGDRGEALDLLEQSLARNARHEQARHLRAVLAGQAEPGSHFTHCPNAAYRQLERGLEYLHAGLFEQARAAFLSATDSEFMARYYLGWAELLRGDRDAALAVFAEAAKQSCDFAFPHQLECVPALEAALDCCPTDSRAAYALGNFWYAHRSYREAIAGWEQCTAVDPEFPTAWRNLSLAYMNHQAAPERARQALERAFFADPSDARILFELDQLRKKLNQAPEARLGFLAHHLDLVLERDDLAIEYVTLLNLTGQHGQALELLLGRRFHPWEGGEGKPTGQYVLSLLQLAREALARERYAAAVTLLERALCYPENLGEGKLDGAQENPIHYLLGCAHRGRGHEQLAQVHFEQAAQGPGEPTSARYYNDQPPEMIYYQGLARRKLGQAEGAETVFRRLIAYGAEHLEDELKLDYFAVSLPDFLVFEDDLNLRHRIHCQYMLALGQSGLGNQSEARQHFEQILAWDASHQGALLRGPAPA